MLTFTGDWSRGYETRYLNSIINIFYFFKSLNIEVSKYPDVFMPLICSHFDIKYLSQAYICKGHYFHSNHKKSKLFFFFFLLICWALILLWLLGCTNMAELPWEGALFLISCRIEDNATLCSLFQNPNSNGLYFKNVISYDIYRKPVSEWQNYLLPCGGVNDRGENWPQNIFMSSKSNSISDTSCVCFGFVTE